MQEVKEPRAQCSRCKDWKPRSDFHMEKSKPLGIQSRCKFCKKNEKLNRALGEAYDAEREGRKEP